MASTDVPVSHSGNPVWDVPTRVFHWSVVACVALSWWSAESGDFERHKWAGYATLVLVITRLAWGLVGSYHSRFLRFLRGPTAVRDYLSGRGAVEAGHNPLGGWSVVALLGALLLQSVSGLFNSDDLMYQGPLYYGASVEWRDAMGALHEWLFYGLLGLVALHVVAVFFHQWIKGEPLIQMMLAGRWGQRKGQEAPVSYWRALALLVLFSVLLWCGVSLAPQGTSW